MLQTFKDKLIKESHEWKYIFFVSIVLNLLAYLGYMVHFTYAVDDYGAIFAEVKHIAHGRWFAGFIYNTLLQKSFMPTLAPIIGMTCYVLTGIGLCKLWNLSKKTSLLVIALWSLHPYLLDVYNFRIATVNCATAYLIAIIALSFVVKGKWPFILAVILFYFSLSIYQVTLGFAIAAIMIQVLLKAYREDFSLSSIRESRRLLAHYIAFLALSIIAYVILTTLIFVVFDVPVNSRIQAGFISNVAALKAKIAVVGSVLFVRMGPVKEFVLPFVGKLVIFMIYILAVIGLLCKKSCRFRSVGGLLWLGLIPLGAISFVLPLETLTFPWRICMGLVVFFVGMLALTQESDSLSIRRTGMILGYFLVVYFILNNNTILYKQHLTNQRDVFMGNRIIMKIQSLDNYQPEMELAIVGRLENGSFSKEGKSNLEIVREYIKHCSVRRYSLASSAFEADWSKYSFLLKYMDLELKKACPQSIEKARRFSKDKKPWPDPSSVFIRDDCVIVVLSLPDK